MTNTYKNIISYFLGSAFCYLFVWFSGIVAAMPVPELLRPYHHFVISYYSNILLVLLAATFSCVVIVGVRKVFSFFTRQNLFYFALPIILFLAYLMAFFSLAVVPLLYAIVPTLLVALLLGIRVEKTE